jgi:deoxyadenosine/deoxycytidine kinase
MEQTLNNSYPVKYKILSIEGNIGSGKSTFLETLKKKYKNNPAVIFIREPVDEWEKFQDNKGETMLKKFYNNAEKYAFPFQMMAYISRLKLLRDVIKNINNIKSTTITCYYIISERSLYTDRYVFAKMLYDQGKIEELNYQIYLYWFNEFTDLLTNIQYIYLKCEPKKCFERITKRARIGEDQIPLEYLIECHQYHENFLKNLPKIEIDGNIDKSELDYYSIIIHKIDVLLVDI